MGGAGICTASSKGWYTVKLLFKQRIFSWFDSYDIYDEQGRVAFEVKGKFAWGHLLEIYTGQNAHVATLKEEVFSFLPRFAIYINGEYCGQIKKQLSLFTPSFVLEYNGWQVTGNIMGWNYTVTDLNGHPVMQASKQLLNWTDTYVIDIENPANALVCLMIVLAIDAAKDNNH